MRQYEKEDCSERAKEGQKFQIGHSYISISPGCECDIVTIFGNPKTRNTVWVPFGSKITIENNEYKVIKGRECAGKRYTKTKEYTLPWYRLKPRISIGAYDHSIECLLDKDKKLHNLEDFMNKEVLVKRLAVWEIRRGISYLCKILQCKYITKID
jgi:hypothetical protein